jgi:hypothetical protein
MDLGLFKSLDKAFEGIEKQLANKVQQAALSVVDEYPGKPGDGSVVVTTAGTQVAFNSPSTAPMYMLCGPPAA